MTTQETRQAKEKGIWGNEKCLQCGACCYALNMELINQPCEFQEIRGGHSYCLQHDDKNARKWPLCEKYFCSQNASERGEEFREIARQLGTAPKTLKN